MKEMIVETIADNGEVTLSVEEYSSTKSTANSIIFAATGFAGWITKTHRGITIVNDNAPAKLIFKVYKMIVW